MTRRRSASLRSFIPVDAPTIGTHGCHSPSSARGPVFSVHTRRVTEATQILRSTPTACPQLNHCSVSSLPVEHVVGKEDRARLLLDVTHCTAQVFARIHPHEPTGLDERVEGHRCLWGDPPSQTVISPTEISHGDHLHPVTLLDNFRSSLVVSRHVRSHRAEY